eukprot:3276383-Amphidinium_carterae.3
MLAVNADAGTLHACAGSPRPSRRPSRFVYSWEANGQECVLYVMHDKGSALLEGLKVIDALPSVALDAHSSSTCCINTVVPASSCSWPHLCILHILGKCATHAVPRSDACTCAYRYGRLVLRYMVYLARAL